MKSIKQLWLFIAFSLPLCLFADNLTLKGSLTGSCNNDKIYMYYYDGVMLQEQSSTPLTEQNGQKSFSFSFKKTPKYGFYFFGTDRNNVRPILIGNKDKTIELVGDCAALSRATITNAYHNALLEKTMGRLNTLNTETSAAVMQFRNAGADLNLQQQAIAAIVETDKKKIALVDSIRAIEPNLSKVISLNVYISWYYDKKGTTDEIQYFGTHYFDNKPIQDADFYNTIPIITDAFKTYTQVMASLGLDPLAVRKFIDANLNKIPSGTPTHKAALWGIITPLMETEPNNFSHYGNMFIKLYGKENPEIVPSIQQRIASLGTKLLGADAPDVKFKTPDGQLLALSDLRGKVVLLDFWASWCGPCIRSLPEVKAIYDQFKAQGFEILALSLDQTDKAWTDAIAKHNLPWKHISDLKGWQSEGAKIYGVTSIPQTFLIDQNGKLAGLNLHGEQLANRIKELLKK